MSRTASILILAIGALSMILTFGIRQTFGLFLPPLHAELGWSIAALSLAWAIQNLLWGAFQPIAGAIADTKGPVWVAFFGGVAYVAGVWLMSEAQSELVFGIGSGVLVGIGLACAGMSVVLGAIMRASPPEKRGLYGGIVTAGGSVGQLIFMPATQAMIETLHWQPTLQILTVVSVVIVLCAFALPRGHKQAAAATNTIGATTIRAALRVAFEDRSYLLLVSGFFVCGFHLAFIGFHLPQFAVLCGLPPKAASDSLALVGGFNAVGCIVIGVMMQRMQSKYLLSGIYFLRAVAIAAFFLLPVTEVSIRVFGAAMGLLWLSTVPPTSGLVARLFGTRYLTMLFGIAFFSHQVGAFIGAYWAGWLFDQKGNYDAVWWVSIALGVLSAIVHLPIRERVPAACRPERTPLVVADLVSLRAALQRNQRLLGLDIGEKTIGLALSDPGFIVASPVATIRRTKFTADAKELLTLVSARGVGGLVIGLPLNMDGSEGPRCQSVRQFAANLLKLKDIPILFWDERMSTMAVEREMIAADLSRAKRGKTIDQAAAAFILQGALDALRSSSN